MEERNNVNNEFANNINESEKKLKNEIFIIVHGIGNGILKQEVHRTLSKNKIVQEYKTLYNNNGSTMVKINIK